MLARAARARRARRNPFPPTLASFDQLTLPWLCPAQARWAANAATPASTPSNSKRQTPLRHASLRTETRSISTAADTLPPSIDPPPFTPLTQPWGAGNASRGLGCWDLSQPQSFVVRGTASALPRLRYEKGIGGDPIELHQNLHACIRVGRLDRAAALVRRLGTIYSPAAPEVLAAHNLYLRARLEAMSHDPVNSKMRDLEEWFDKEITNSGIEPDDQTLVAMIQGSLSFLRDEKMKVAVRKYLAVAENLGPDVYEAVNTSPEFTEEEWDALVRLQGEDFEEPSTMDKDFVPLISTPAGRSMAVEHGLMRDPAPAVREIQQKGRGMKTLKEALSTFDPSKAPQYPHDMEGSQEEKDRAYAVLRQIQLEENAVDATVERWKYENDALAKIGIHGALKSKSMGALMWEWYTTLVPLVQKELDAVKKALANEATHKHSERLLYGSYLELFDAKTLAAITVSRLVAALAAGVHEKKARVSTLTIGLVDALELEYNAQVAKSQKSSNEGVQRSLSRRQVLSKLTKGKFKFDPTRHQKQSRLTEASDLIPTTLFPIQVKAKIGAILIESFLQAATITVTREDPRTGETLSSVQPAYAHGTTYIRGKQIGIIVPHNELLMKLTREPLRGASSFRLPMVVEPKPWVSFREGGYYRYPTKVVRTKDGDQTQEQYASSAVRKGDMDRVFAGLDVLGRTPWQINKDVYGVMIEAWNAGEGIGELVPGDIDMSLPEEPPSGAPMAERIRWYKQVKEIAEKRQGLHSKRCFQNLQLEMARSYLDETFYYPHNVDFRGRAYPIPPTLNHMGADIARGLLKFGTGRELGTIGLQWLKIHLANLYGFDKASLREREEFAMEHLNEVYDSATNPLSGKRWWLKAEDPWQCLACCFELKKALDSPDPSRYVSSFPVHQDGTCNGLQHYAALGGDANGASQVNLEPSDRPQDIYTGVAELVKDSIGKNAKEGLVLAKFLDGKITRKVVKRTVMTNVYGVTFEGARLQVLEELKAAMPDFVPTPEVPSLGSAAAYVAKKIFEALAQIFNGAQDIQIWLGECASRISTSVTAEQIQKLQQAVNDHACNAFDDPRFKTKKTKIGTAVQLQTKQAKIKKAAMDFKSSVIWTTPLRMPVVQPYRTTKSTSIKTCLQSLNLAETKASDAVSKRKQLQAFPPNFIHSLDATHMLLSALKCGEEGLTFAAVHDSFWTHPADIPKLNEILRDAFVRMHSEDVIGRLAAEFKARYAGSMYLADLKPESSAAQQVVALRKQRQAEKGQRTAKITSAAYEELILETERRRLLQSEDLDERSKGQAMVTPASIYEAAQDASALVIDSQQPLIGQTTNTKAKQLQSKMINAELSEKEGQAFEPAVDEAAQDIKASNPDTIVKDIGAEADLGEKGINSRAAKSKQAKSQNKVQIWLPLTFPPVPKKGDFDVRRLKESKYFFS